MAYTVQNALDVAQKLGKGVPFTNVDVTLCDQISSIIYRAYPWRDTLKTSPDNWNEVSLTDGNQDFATGLTDIFRMTQFWIRRSDVSPNKVVNITVSKSIAIDLQPKSPSSIRSASYQAGANKFRLETAIRIPTGATYKIGGEYQPQHTKITALNNALWFQDEFLDTYIAGLTWKAYELADHPDRGTVQFREGAQPIYTGKLGEFMASIAHMAGQEDFGNIDGYYPSDSLGAVDGRRWYANELFPYLS